MQSRSLTTLAAAVAVAVVGILLVAASQCTTPREKAKVTNLPNVTFSPNFDSYAGYITLNGTQKNIFYWFCTSQGSPSQDPLVLWLQGGPGCSGLDGLMSENGPFSTEIVNAQDQTVNLVPKYYSWNRVSNMLYIESPVGVGFSYSDNDADYRTGDNQTAIDTYQFMLQFSEMYPEWNDNQFFITGESYGGVYIPTLANQILFNESSVAAAATLKSQLLNGGIMLGNPVTRCDGARFGGQDDIEFLNTKVNLYYWHALVSRSVYDSWMDNKCDQHEPPSFEACMKVYAAVVRQAGIFKQPDAHAFLDASPHFGLHMQQQQQRQQQRVNKVATNPDCLYYSYCTGNGTIEFDTARVADCFNIGEQTAAYYNNQAVQGALHAKPQKWSSCRLEIGYKRDSGPIMPYLQKFFADAKSMRVLYYSGDIDIGTVPFANTQRCLETLADPITEEWRPWVVNDLNEVAGYIEVYEHYQYATLKAAGHEAPQFQPASAYTLFTAFLNNDALPMP